MRLVTVSEAAKFMRISPSTVRRMIHGGLLGAVMIRGCWRVPMESPPGDAPAPPVDTGGEL